MIRRYDISHLEKRSAPRERQSRLANPKAMTLIAGIRCIDGFLVAADTAISDGDILYRGQKIDHYIGKNWRMVIACAGDLSCARTAARQINEKFLRDEVDVSSLIGFIEAELIDVHEKHIYPRTERGTENLNFALIIGIECQGLPQVLRTSGTRVTKQEPYVFDGIGHDLAVTYAESFLRSRQNDSLPIYAASALHIVDEIFRIVKRFGVGVGLDTRIYAWRNADSTLPFFELDKNSQDIFWSIQEQLKSAIWSALEPNSDIIFNQVKDIPRVRLEQLHEAVKQETKHDFHFISYTNMPRGNESRIRPLDL